MPGNFWENHPGNFLEKHPGNFWQSHSGNFWENNSGNFWENQPSNISAPNSLHKNPLSACDFSKKIFMIWQCRPTLLVKIKRTAEHNFG